MRIITKTDWNCEWIHVYDYTLDDIRELQKKQGGGYLEHIVCFAHYGNTLMKLKINSRNAVRRVLYDSPRIADDDRRER